MVTMVTILKGQLLIFNLAFNGHLRNAPKRSTLDARKLNIYRIVW